ncbi:MAG: glucose-6-phosphate dehydrogenase, partial [Phycisphaerae bacterium]|nr:glucose-6-phosphate dehydrogenase [Phycisphaerae bacterium]
MREPAAIVIFGASGDLTSRKLIPALFVLRAKGRIRPGTHVVGFSRTPMSDAAFRDHLFEQTRGVLGTECHADCWREFARSIFYQPGDINQANDFTALDQRLRELAGEFGQPTGRLYYLSTAPQFYTPAIEQLGRAGMAAETEGFRRVVIEKPFGHDLPS